MICLHSTKKRSFDSIGHGDLAAFNKKTPASIRLVMVILQRSTKNAALTELAAASSVPSARNARSIPIGHGDLSAFNKKRSFDSIGHGSLSSFNKRPFDSIAHGDLSAFNKRRLDRINQPNDWSDRLIPKLKDYANLGRLMLFYCFKYWSAKKIALKP